MDWKTYDNACEIQRELIYKDMQNRIASLESQLAEAERTIAELRADRDGEHDRRLDWRGIEPADACGRCHGAGVRAYGSTATWRGGIGGQAITSDVCDGCWGSGSRSAWASWRNGGRVSALESQVDLSDDLIRDARASLAVAERERDEANSTIAEWKRRNIEVLGDAKQRIDDLIRERDEAIRVAVGVARGCLRVVGEFVWRDFDWLVETDGTDAGIYRALREAMGGEVRWIERNG